MQPVTVTPSTVESVRRCSLRWLLERHGGGARPTPEQGVGNLVHAAAMLATDAEVDRATLVDYVAGRFDEIELSARWLAGRERQRAEQMIDKLVGWLAANPRRLAAIEKDFLVQLDEVTRIKGRVDRLEVDDQGRLVVIDLKTGKTTSVTEADLPEQPQLGAYQAAVEAGAFPEYGDESGRRGAGPARQPHQRQGAAAAAAGRVRRPDLGGGHGEAYRGDHGGGHVPGGRQLEVPQLSGAHELSGLRQGPAGHRRAPIRAGHPHPEGGRRVNDVERRGARAGATLLPSRRAGRSSGWRTGRGAEQTWVAR